MAIYAPTILNFPNGLVSVQSTTSTSYEQIINSMGSFLYSINQMYIQALANNQLLVPTKFNTYDVNGTLQDFSQVTTIDPYQYQASSFFELSKSSVVLNGRTTLETTVLPSENIHLILYACEASNQMLLKGSTIFDDYFFTDYKDTL